MKRDSQSMDKERKKETTVILQPPFFSVQFNVTMSKNYYNKDAMTGTIIPFGQWLNSWM